MKTSNCLPLLFCLLATSLFSQSNIQQSLSVNSSGAAADASAQLDVSATDKGMLVPRMTTAQRTAIASPATGLLVYDTTTGDFWFYIGAVWKNLSSQKVLQDTDGNTIIQVEESPNEDIIRFDLAGTESMVLRKNAGGQARLELPNMNTNLFIGTNAGYEITTAVGNTGTGFSALSSNTIGYANTAFGVGTLSSNTIGGGNAANGYSALASNIDGGSNTANGYYALSSNTHGNQNAAFGAGTLTSNTTGNHNTANGTFALSLNLNGNYNTASGHSALYKNTSGSTNTANGVNALINNTDGSSNTANGVGALYSNSSGSFNIANGFNALYTNSSGSQNVATGYQALHFALNSWNTAMGSSAGTDSDNSTNCTYIGFDADNNLYFNTYSNSTAFGNAARMTASDQVRIGNAGVMSIGGF